MLDRIERKGIEAGADPNLREPISCLRPVSRKWGQRAIGNPDRPFVRRPGLKCLGKKGGELAQPIRGSRKLYPIDWRQFTIGAQHEASAAEPPIEAD